MRDPRIEQYLDKRRLTYKYRTDVPFGAIEVDNLALQNIRLDQPLDQDHIISMALVIEDKVDLPAIVLAKDGERYKVLNGCHRMEAYRMQKTPPTELDAYIVDTASDREWNIIRHTMNRVEGKKDSSAEQLQHALYLVQSLGMTAKDAAHLCNLKSNMVSDRIACEKILARLAKFGLSPSDVIGKGKLSYSHVRKAGTIQRDGDLYEVIRLALEYRLSATDLDPIVEEVRQVASDDQMAGYLAKWRQDRSTLKREAEEEPTAADRAVKQIRRIPVRCDVFMQAISSQKLLRGFRGANVKVLEQALTSCQRAMKVLQLTIDSLREQINRLKAAKAA